MPSHKNIIAELNSDGIGRSLILAGGGVRLAYHAGVLIALEEEGLSFNHIDGTSGGIFGTAMLASGITPVEASKRWRKLKLKGFTGILPLKEYRNRNTLKLIDGAEGIRKMIFPALGIDIKSINANTSFAATFNVCNFSKKAVESIPNHSVTIDHLIAGVSLPMFIPATKINGDWYTDAVWIKDANLTEAVVRNAREIWLIWCIGNTREYLKGYFNEYVHMIEISANAGLIKELDWIKRENMDREKNGQIPVMLHIVKPEYSLPLDPAFFMKKIDANTLINMGYADTMAYISSKRAFDFAENTTATAMKGFDATLHFRQEFSGYTMFDGKKHPACFYFAFFIREIKDTYVVQQFTSVELDNDTMIPGYDNTVSKMGKGILASTFKIKYAADIFQISTTICFSSIPDLVLGLDIKNIFITITDSKGGQTAGRYYQPAVNRVKNAFHLNVNENAGIIKKWKSKYRILNYLFN